MSQFAPIIGIEFERLVDAFEKILIANRGEILTLPAGGRRAGEALEF